MTLTFWNLDYGQGRSALVASEQASHTILVSSSKRVASNISTKYLEELQVSKSPQLSDQASSQETPLDRPIAPPLCAKAPCPQVTPAQWHECLKADEQETRRVGTVDGCEIHVAPPESQSKPGIKMVDPEPCKETQRRPQLFIAGIVPY